VTKLSPISEAARADLDRLAKRELSDEEWRTEVAIPLLAEEIGHTQALARWFCRRYPTAASRLAYVRRAYARWQRSFADPFV